MLTASDIAASQNSRLSPNAQSAINAIAAVRSATLERLVFQSYPASTTSTIITHTFPGASFAAGSQVRIFIWGEITNASGTPKSFSPSLYVTQAAAIQSAAFLYTAPNGTSQFIIDAAVSFSPIGSAISGDPPSLRTLSSAPASVLAAGSMIRLANRTGTTTVAQDFAVVSDPNSLTIDQSQPVGISVQVNTGASETFTVLGGWMEGI